MTSSFEKINYSIRPAKATERRMLIETFGRLAPIYPLSQYQYIGFGSTFFLDFKMVHRHYGIRHLTSVEKEHQKKPRFDFNKPFSCIKMHYETASSFFSSSAVNWNRPMIAWLDYDDRMSSSVLADIDRVVEKAAPGSLVVVTVNAHPPGARERVTTLESEIDLRQLLHWADGSVTSLSNWKLARAYRGMATSNLESTLRKVRPDCRWHPLLNFHYSDGPRMLTFGGLLVDSGVKKVLKQCRFDELPYVRHGEEPFEIEVPNLTEPEIHQLGQYMPNLTKRGRERLVGLAIANQDLTSYGQLYRYLPRFVESYV
jgi:hypothetical protein